jgi:hypothetical protein
MRGIIRSMTMRVLSIQQPWASLIMHGRKPIELRSWPTQHRGPLAVHAARRFGAAQRRLCIESPMCGVLARVGIRRLADLPLGCILGTVTVLDCVPASDVADSLEFPAAPDDFAWLLADPEPLPAPIPYIGQLGLCELPAKIAERLVYIP